jgi:hypothetical protein
MCLTRQDRTPDARITEAHRYIGVLDPEYWRSDERAEFATFKAAGKHLLQTYLLAESELPDDLRDLMLKVADSEGQLSESETLYFYVDLHLKFSQRLSNIRQDTKTRALTLADIMANYLAFAGHRTQSMLYEASTED